MNSPKIGDLVSLDAVATEHVRQVVNKTSTLNEATHILKRNARWLLRFRNKYHLGPPKRNPPPTDDAETWTDD